MSGLLAPDDEQQVCDAVAGALAEHAPLEILGGGSKRTWGRPVQVARSLSLRGLAGIRLYEPNELVMSAGAGTPLSEVQAALAAHRQHLAFEPPDFAGMLGGSPGAGSTIGGAFACNLGGPRRPSAGAARDHLLGFRAVSGRGEVFKAGGRVVKNVTGFDLSKLMAGSFGTLAALTEVTFKVLPAPEETRTVLVAGLDDEAAVRALRQTLQSCHEVSGAAHLPAAAAARCGLPDATMGQAMTAVRVEGPGPSVAYRCAALCCELAVFGDTCELDGALSRQLWAAIRDVLPFAEGERLVWRVTVPPASAAAVVAEIAGQIAVDHFFDRGGGLVWLAIAPDAADGGAAVVRRSAASVGGIAALVRAPEALRGHVEVFHPLAEPLRGVTARIKEAFDPVGIFNPGRMYAGI